MKPALRILSGPAGTLLLVVVMMSVVMIVAGSTPWAGFGALFGGALGGPHELAETLAQTTALLFPALGICLAFRAGLFNIGAEGQLLLGGLAAGALGANFTGPGWLAVPMILAAGIVGGGLWGALAGWMKSRFNANEIISTLMLNYVAISIANYLVAGPLKSPLATGAETAPLPASSWLPTLIPDTRLTIALLIAVGIAALLQFVFARTVFGYELRALGEAPEAARRNHVDINRLTWMAMGLSGAIAGLGGAAIVAGELHRFNTQLSPGYGFTAIAVALVGDLHPLWICLAAFGFGILEAGGLAMQASAGVPKDAIHLIEGIIILVLAAKRFVSTRVEVPAV